MERQTNQYDLCWWRESAFRLGCERGCGLDVRKTSAGMMQLPTSQNIRWRLSGCIKGITAPLSAWKALLQSSQQHSEVSNSWDALRKDGIRNLLCTDTGSVRIVGALIFRQYLSS